MSDIIAKAQRSAEITRDAALAASHRVFPALDALAGLTLSDLDAASHSAVKTQLIAINRRIDGYDMKADAGYEQFTEPDAVEILDRITTVTQLCLDSEVERVMRELDSADRILPVAAIREVRTHRDIFVPRLISTLKRAVASIRSGQKPQDDAFFAMFLLTELEVDEAFPVLLDALHLPGNGLYHLLGDGVHELIPSMLALFARGNIGTISEIVCDCDIDMYVRWSSATAFKYLVRDGLLSRHDAIEYLHRHFQDCIHREDYDLLAPLACELGDLAAADALETIRSAYQDGLVDEELISLAFIESQIAAGEKTARNALDHCPPTGVPDTIKELSRWAEFREDPPKPQQQQRPEVSSAPWSHPLTSGLVPSQLVTARRSDAKVGRNDPCPCGSGKKFKKCCR